MARPNILLITTDQQHPETLGCMGNPVIRTPHVDALASEGVTFFNCFTTMALCTPARTSIFTGLAVRSHGVPHNVNMNFEPGPYALSPDVVAFPELLAAEGYDTAFFGKLHARHE
ncbi:MAG: sulfatase-like hydrolase/transferase, partial [Armatimonadetes bacterium]|nr:sulfatase-like hydrolase/transferase [Armatimonadota bacterium]